MESARLQANLAPPEFRAMVSLYFVSRYFTVLFEARYGEIPLQVWDEYRKALDHFMQSLTQEKDTIKHSQLRKMEDHLFRAAVDILKMFCHRGIKDIEKELGAYSKKVWLSLNNGDIYHQISLNLYESVSEFEKAKLTGLGDEQSFSSLSVYLSPAFKLVNTRDMLQEALPELHQLEKLESNVINQKVNQKVSDKKFQIFGSLAAGIGVGAIASIFFDEPTYGLALAIAAITIFQLLIRWSSK